MYPCAIMDCCCFWLLFINLILLIPHTFHSHSFPTEMGSYLALDVGGTNLRVVSVHLTGGGEISTRQTKYRIDEHLKVGDAKSLFGKWIIICITISDSSFPISLPTLSFSSFSISSSCLFFFSRGGE